ncbi:PREDICTED: fatty acyl-CoA reductase 1-like [Papilio polytes]|uniref:fatty acyl-CoA reductase 1-like n=1 Tax=Papilio polytes TaxID=76194 RepID=UPI000676B07A|nr:PREDICTED: fatty acyl-CoA reductase 1-like [Papilio polytes]
MLRRLLYPVSADFKLIEGQLKCFSNMHTTSKTRDSFGLHNNHSLSRNRTDVLPEHPNTCTPIADFYAGKSILITGGAGFLGKVFIERLLFNCSEIDKIFVILREKKGIKAEQRLQHITESPLFSKLKETRPKDLDKIVPIEGDMELERLGLKSDDQKTILENVSVVFHSAAEIRFHKPLKHTLKVNVEGTREVLKLCRQMDKMEAFVYVSTAYSQAERKIIEEIVYPPPDKLSEVYKTLESNNSTKEMKQILKGKFSTYTFSKAMAESLVAEEHGNVPTIIVRPSVVGAICGEPLPGWVDNWNGATGLIYDFGRGVNKVFHGQRETITDMIPVDYIVNLAIVAATKCSDNKDVKVYNSCSSLDNPLICGYLKDKCAEAYRKIHNDNSTAKAYFFKSPWMVSIVCLLYQMVPAHVADFWLRCRGMEPRYVKELKPAIVRRDLLKKLTSMSFFWRTEQTRSLYVTLSQQDQRQFPFDPKNVSWDEYFENYFKGIYKYLNVKK